MRLRDQAALVEQQGNTETIRVGSEEASLMRQRAAEEVQADVDARVRATRNAARRFLDELRAEACGKESLFADGVVVAVSRQLPEAPAAVAVPGNEDSRPEIASVCGDICGKLRKRWRRAKDRLLRIDE